MNNTYKFSKHWKCIIYHDSFVSTFQRAFLKLHTALFFLHKLSTVTFREETRTTVSVTSFDALAHTDRPLSFS